MLEKKARELVEEMDEIMSQLSKQLMGQIDIDCLDDDEIENLKLLKRCYGLMDKSMGFMLEQARMMDSIDKKLDRLIEKSR